MISLKKAVKLSLFLIAFSFSSFAYSWSKEGHEAITYAAISALNMEQRGYYKELATALFNSNDLPQKATTEGFGAVVRFGSFPDTIRDKLISDIFGFYDESVPKLLLEYSDETSNRWHYHNIVRRDKTNSQCEFVNRGKLLDRLILLDAVLKSSISKRQEALLLSFQIHLIQDLHQPLHTLTKLGASCTHDFGGNRTCVEYKTNGQCKLNLHRYWDSGFGVFDRLNISTLDSALKNAGENNFSPEKWAAENSEFYDHIYHLDNLRYHEASKELVRKRLSLAVRRLTYYLKTHYEYIRAS